MNRPPRPDEQAAPADHKEGVPPYRGFLDTRAWPNIGHILRLEPAINTLPSPTSPSVSTITLDESAQHSIGNSTLVNAQPEQLLTLSEGPARSQEPRKRGGKRA